MITKYGTDVAIPVLVVSALIIVLAVFISNTFAKVAFIAVGSGVFLFTLNFFRDPDRKTPNVIGGVVSPADGKVILIREVTDTAWTQEKAIQISVFMSPINVHVNRFPVTGTVEYFRYIPGRYIMAFEEKASERNERTVIGINTGRHKVLFKQIAGFIARRIVCPIKQGDSARIGERFGMIKFGSRVDVLVPLDARIEVSLNQTVTAGETVLAVLNSDS